MNRTEVQKLARLLREKYQVILDQKPLAIGVHRSITEFEGLSKTAIKKIMLFFTHHPKYLKATAQEGRRYHLDGTVSGHITKEQMEHAQRMIELQQAKIKARLYIKEESA